MTLFDQGFLPNGLALHASLVRHAGDFTLWVLCIDEQTERTLNELELPGVRTAALHDFETSELLSVKDGREPREYYWTLTPFTPKLVFDRDPGAARATYIDADMWLASSPAPIFGELDSSDAAVLITEHAYAKEFEQSLAYGIYCVQFMPFVRGRGEEIAQWWQEKVIDWCFAEPDAGRFGDQKYLDDWPTRFGSDIRVLQNPQWTQAPWNATRFAARDAITYHFHRLRTVDEHRALVGLYRLPSDHVDRLYRPYLADLRTAYGQLRSVGFRPRPQTDLGRLVPRTKDWLAFRKHNWKAPTTPYALPF